MSSVTAVSPKRVVEGLSREELALPFGELLERVEAELDDQFGSEPGDWYWDGDFASRFQEEIEQRKSAASALGKRGGSKRSDAKTAAARENGRKGGRPKLTLEEVWDWLEDTEWETQRFRQFPQTFEADILHVWRQNEAGKAMTFFRTHRAETKTVGRAAWLFSDSLGAALAVTEGPW
jgi:hypothetical protein